tara:strand:+ start:1670 stop:2671 length:1002 start_codon:yes stop_codon:yes gene_type:complete
MNSGKMYKAFVVDSSDSGTAGAVKELNHSDLPEGNVTVRILWSSLNYKDGLAITGFAPIIRNLPMTAGIDFAGIVESSDTSDFSVGEHVILTGWGLGERHPGGFSQQARVNSGWLERIPDGLDAKTAMALGTAGFTSMLCVLALESAGIKPEKGPVLVTGAAGGVGSIAVAILSNLGYEVTAVTGRHSAYTFLKSLGASNIISREELCSNNRKPLMSERWAGAIDPVGGDILSHILSELKYGSAVAACGLAGGSKINTTVLPFILRGVSLLGVDSVMCPSSLRRNAWARLATDMPKNKLESITVVEPMKALPDLAQKILNGQIQGRVVIDVNS